MESKPYCHFNLVLKHVPCNILNLNQSGKAAHNYKTNHGGRGAGVTRQMLYEFGQLPTCR